MTEFSYNTVSATTGSWLCMATTLGIGSCVSDRGHKATEFAENLSSLDAYLRDVTTWSQAIYAEQADGHRLLAPKLEVSDKVWLLRRHIKTTRPSEFPPLNSALIGWASSVSLGRLALTLTD